MVKNKFALYDFEKANEVFSGLKTQIEKTAANRKYVEGDDWQGGKGWVGPHFEQKGRVSEILKKEVERDFASKSDIKSAVRRHRRGVIGRVPNWMISSRNAPATPDAEPSADEEERIGEAQKILNEFWKNSRVHQTLQTFVTDYLTDEHAILRLFFVQNDEGEVETVETIEDAVKMIHLFREKPEAGCVVLDKKTLKRASFLRYEENGVVYIEMCYVGDDGKTVFKKLSKSESKEYTQKQFPNSLGKYTEDGQPEQSDELRLPLNEKLLIFEMKGEAFITAAMRSQQKLVNKAFTMMSHNLDEDGFRKKKILNGLPPGKFEKDAAGKEIYVPNPDGEVVGAGSISYTSGLPITERDGDKIRTGYTTPSVHESEPVDVNTFIESARTASEAILEEADQKHVAISGEAEPSGESRIQARDDFRQSLEDTKSNFDGTVSEVFETVLAVVAYLMGKEGRYKDLQVTVSALLNVGPKSIEERRVAMEEREKGVRSLESNMEEANITDPDAMKQKIAEEQKAVGVDKTPEKKPEDVPTD